MPDRSPQRCNNHNNNNKAAAAFFRYVTPPLYAVYTNDRGLIARLRTTVLYIVRARRVLLAHGRSPANEPTAHGLISIIIVIIIIIISSGQAAAV